MAECNSEPIACSLSMRNVPTLCFTTMSLLFPSLPSHIHGTPHIVFRSCDSSQRLRRRLLLLVVSLGVLGASQETNLTTTTDEFTSSALNEPFFPSSFLGVPVSRTRNFCALTLVPRRDSGTPRLPGFIWTIAYGNKATIFWAMVMRRKLVDVRLSTAVAVRTFHRWRGGRIGRCPLGQLHSSTQQSNHALRISSVSFSSSHLCFSVYRRDEMAMNDEDVDDDEVDSQSFGLETEGHDMEEELMRLFGGTATSSAGHPTAPDQPLATEYGSSAPPHHHATSSRARDITDEDEAAELSRPKPPTRRPLVLTVEREHHPLPRAPVPLVPSLLTRSRWPEVRHQQYHHAVPVVSYVQRCRDLAMACEAFLQAPRHQRSALWEELSSLHSDALLCMIEELVKGLAPSAEGEKRSVKQDLMRGLWSLLSGTASSAGRAEELSSKQIAWAATLFEQSRAVVPALPTTFLHRLIYASRRGLRRQQNLHCLQVLLRHPPAPADDSNAPLEKLYGACLSCSVARCLDVQPTHKSSGVDDETREDAFSLARLLIEVLSLRWHDLAPVVQQAALRGVLSRLRNGGRRGRSGGLPACLNGVVIHADRSPAPFFQHLKKALAETDAFGVARIDRKHLADLLCKTHKGAGVDWVTSKSSGRTDDKGDKSAAQDVGSWLSSVASQPSPKDSNQCEEYLRTATRIHTHVCHIERLADAVALVGPVKRHFPLLSNMLAVKVLSLLPENLHLHHAVTHPDAAPLQHTLLASTLTALYQLLPHTDRLEVVQAFLSITASLLPQLRDVLAHVSQSLLRCVTSGVPPHTVPLVLAHVTRQRELAVRPATLLWVQTLHMLVMSVPIESFAKGVLHTSELLIAEEERKLMDDTGPQDTHRRALVALREGCSSRKLTVSTALATVAATPVSSGNRTPSAPSHATALHELFGYSSPTERTVAVPEVVLGCQTALAWLYQVFSMSRSLAYEVQLLAQLASTQGVELHLSDRKAHLVRLSEEANQSDELLLAGEDAKLLAWVDSQNAPNKYVRAPIPPTVLQLTNSPVERHSDSASTASLFPSSASTVEATYVEQLTREASWKCLSFYLNATLLEQSRERPNADYPVYAQQELHKQLSIGDAADSLIRCFFAKDHEEEDDSGTNRRGGEEAGYVVPRAHLNVPARDVLPLLGLYEAYLAAQTSAFPYNKAALLNWTRCATCLCLSEMLSERMTGQEGVSLQELLAVYKYILAMSKESVSRSLDSNRRSAGERGCPSSSAATATAEGGSAADIMTLGTEALSDTYFGLPPPPPALPASLHEHVFAALTQHPSLWEEAIPLLTIVNDAAAVQGSRVAAAPTSVYRLVMQTCLMHRTVVPEHIRAKMQ